MSRAAPGDRPLHRIAALVASRYEDIRAAVTDPRMSANTLPESVKPPGEEDDMPVFFAGTDDPEYSRLRRMLTMDFTVRRTKEMAPRSSSMVLSASLSVAHRELAAGKP